MRAVLSSLVVLLVVGGRLDPGHLAPVPATLPAGSSWPYESFASDVSFSPYHRSGHTASCPSRSHVILIVQCSFLRWGDPSWAVRACRRLVIRVLEWVARLGLAWLFMTVFVLLGSAVSVSSALTSAFLYIVFFFLAFISLLFSFVLLLFLSVSHRLPRRLGDQPGTVCTRRRRPGRSCSLTCLICAFHLSTLLPVFCLPHLSTRTFPVLSSDRPPRGLPRPAWPGCLVWPSGRRRSRSRGWIRGSSGRVAVASPLPEICSAARALDPVRDHQELAEVAEYRPQRLRRDFLEGGH